MIQVEKEHRSRVRVEEHLTFGMALGRLAIDMNEVDLITLHKRTIQISGLQSPAFETAIGPYMDVFQFNSLIYIQQRFTHTMVHIDSSR